MSAPFTLPSPLTSPGIAAAGTKFTTSVGRYAGVPDSRASNFFALLRVTSSPTTAQPKFDSRSFTQPCTSATSAAVDAQV